MTKAIITRYHGPTNTKGSRISAFDMDKNRVSIPYPHELNFPETHRAALAAFLTKMNAKGYNSWGSPEDYVMGSLPKNDMAWVSKK